MKIEVAKYLLYGLVVVCFMAAGTLDLVGRNWKSGILAVGFGILNALIFFWR